MSQKRYANLLRESSQLALMLQQLSLGLSKSDINCAEIAWEGYIQNLELIRSKLLEASTLVETDENIIVTKTKVLSRDSELSHDIAKRIRKAPKFREVPLTYNEELEDFDEDRMVR